MSKFLKTVFFAGLLAASTGTVLAQDADAGAKVFNKCKACHMVGEGAKHRVGPELNGVLGRMAGTAEGFKYSKAMISAGSDGLVWDDASLADFLAAPKKVVKGTKMAFAGLKKPEDVTNLLAYLKNAAGGQTAASETGEAPTAEKIAAADQKASPEPVDPADMSTGPMKLGRKALPEEITAWDIDVRPDGTGLPVGKGTVAEGSVLFEEQCASCHGVFGEGEGRWPVLAGGQGTLKDDRPVKTVGSYWPYLSTVYDYVKRAMPFGNARSLSDDDVYALTAYILFLNDVVTDEEFELSGENFAGIRLPNEENFFMDDRMDEPHYSAKAEPCMTDCKPEAVKIIMRARVLDVTPDGEDDEGQGAIE